MDPELYAFVLKEEDFVLYFYSGHSSQNITSIEREKKKAWYGS